MDSNGSDASASDRNKSPQSLAQGLGGNLESGSRMGETGGGGAREKLTKTASEDMEENSYYLYLSSNPVRFEPMSKVTKVFYDEANRQVFTIRLNGLSVVAKGPTDRVNISFSLPDKGEVKSIKFSPDLKTVAVQRSPRTVV